GRKMPWFVTRPWGGPMTSSREDQPSSSGSKAPSRRGGGSGAGSSRLRRSTRPSPRATVRRGIGGGPLGGIAQVDPRPAREVGVARRPVADQVAARQLGQRRLALRHRLLAEPVADEDE